jgi:hypothetical protein
LFIFRAVVFLERELAHANPDATRTADGHGQDPYGGLARRTDVGG